MRLDRITLAANDVEAMVNFYNAVFRCGLEPAQNTITDSVLYRGIIGDVTLVIQTNEIMQVDANRNRHQLHFVIENIDKLINAVTQNGGEIISNPAATSVAKTAKIADPDGNIISLFQPL